MQPTRWLALAALIVALALASRTQADPDLWGHVRFGIDIIHSHALLSVDPYSFTQDRPWVNHEWLSEVQMGLAYLAFGSAGLALLKALLAVTALASVWWSLCGSAFEARIVALAAVVCGAWQIEQTLRPQVWSVVCLATLCGLLRRTTGTSRAFIPILFVVWANLHGGWIVGLGVLGLWLVVETMHASALLPRNAALIAVSALATLATPYGWTLWQFLAETVRVRRPAIEEWQSIVSLGWDKWIPWIGATIAILLASRRRFAAKWPTLTVLAMMACISFRVARIVPLFVVADGVLLGPALASAWPVSAASVFGKDRVADVVVAALAMMSAVAAAVFMLPRTLSCVASDPRTSPDRAVLIALGAAPPGRLVTFFDWGERAIWFVGPRITVSMDGRRETVYSDAMIAAHDAVLFGTPDAWPILERWQAEYVWLPASSRGTRAWLQEHGYRVDMTGEQSFLAVRADRPPIAPVPAAASRCFPE